MKRLVLIALVVAVASAQTAFDTITPESLRERLSYLASDQLEGRNTPSHGLDLAADYIAQQFQRENLKPAAPDGTYFQTANFVLATADLDGFSLTVNSGGRKFTVPPVEARIRSVAPLDLTNAAILRVAAEGPVPNIAGRVVSAPLSRSLDELQAGKPLLILVPGTYFSPQRPVLENPEDNRAPVIRIMSRDVVSLLRSSRPLSLSVTLHLAPSRLTQIPLRNVAAILPGSDPTLRDQYVLLTAHYDHLGKTAQGIFNGANDNASGTSSVIEIAGALARANPHPKRSILFLTFFGEEKGLLGSYYYVEHPLVPLNKTIAEINLEQLGRTDETTGREVGAIAFTGPDYTDLPALLKSPARAEGIKVYARPDADDFFDRSDNYAFAAHGVVDTTIAVAFEFPDYHAIGDKVAKIDFQNLAKVDRAIAADILSLANNTSPAEMPKWSDAPGTRQFKDARHSEERVH